MNGYDLWMIRSLKRNDCEQKGNGDYSSSMSHYEQTEKDERRSTSRDRPKICETKSNPRDDDREMKTHYAHANQG